MITFHLDENVDHAIAHGLILLLFCGLICTAAPAAELVEVRKIWDQAPHNAFTDLIHFEDRWYCVFREGKGHAGRGDFGAVRVIASVDGEKWESVARFAEEQVDLRDAKFSVTADGRLMLNSCRYWPAAPQGLRNQSVSFLSDDGKTWEGPHIIGDKNFWLWRTEWRAGSGHSFGYGTTDANRGLRLYKTHDGKTFDTLLENVTDEGYPNETALVFTPDATCYCLLRRDGRPNTALLGTARPPYQEWNWRDLGVRIGGPEMIRLPDGRLLACVRSHGPTRTELYQVDPDAGELKSLLKFPSGGDCSYAGMVWHNDLLWVSYYSSHEGKASIYLAQVRPDL